MTDTAPPMLESNGLLDFLPTPPRSVETTSSNGDQTQGKGKGNGNAGEQDDRNDRINQNGMDFGSPPPPDFDEEPSDFEDEMQEIMANEERSSRGTLQMSLDMDAEIQQGHDLDSRFPRRGGSSSISKADMAGVGAIASCRLTLTLFSFPCNHAPYSPT
jgi:hypothetical protein